MMFYNWRLRRGLCKTFGQHAWYQDKLTNYDTNTTAFSVTFSALFLTWSFSGLSHYARAFSSMISAFIWSYPDTTAGWQFFQFILGLVKESISLCMAFKKTRIFLICWIPDPLLLLQLEQFLDQICSMTHFKCNHANTNRKIGPSKKHCSVKAKMAHYHSNQNPI